MARPARRRPGLAGQRRQRAGDPAPHLPGRHHRRLDLDKGRRPRGAHRPGRRRPRQAPDVLGELEDPGARLDPGRPGPGDQHPGAGEPAPHLGACRPPRRRPGRDPAVRPRRRHRPRPAHGAAVRADGTRGGLVEAVPRRYGGQAVDRPRGRRRIRAAARGPRRQHRVPAVGGGPDRVPLRPRGHRRALLLPRRRLRPAPPHAPRRVLRPARRDRRHPCRLLQRR